MLSPVLSSLNEHLLLQRFHTYTGIDHRFSDAYWAQLYYTITGFDYVTTSPDGFVAVIVKYS